MKKRFEKNKKNSQLNIQVKNYWFILLVVAFLIRLIFIFEIEKTPFIKEPVSDSKIYLDWANEIIKSSFWGDEVFFMSPAYPYFLAVMFAIFGNSIIIIQIFQALLSVLTLYLVFLISKKVFNDNVAFISLIIATFFDSLIFYSGILLSEVFLTFLVTLIIYLLLNEFSESDRLRIFHLGLLFGIASVFKANLLVIAFICGIFISYRIYKKSKFKKSLAISGLIYFLGVVIPIIPITIRNYVVGNEFVLISANGGINFYIGNNEKAIGVYKTPEEFNFFEDMSGKNYVSSVLKKELNYSETSNYWLGKGFDFIINHPDKFLILTIKKLLIFIGWFENYQSASMDIGFFKENFSITLYLGIFGFYIISLFGFPGLIYSFNKINFKVLHLFILSFILVNIIFFVNGRFRMPVVPIMIVFSSYMIYEIYNFIKEKNVKKLVYPLLLVFSFFLTNLFLVPEIEYNYYDGYVSLGNYYFGNGDISNAKKYMEKAVSIQPTAFIIMNLANIYAAEGNYEEAIDTYKKSLALNPNSSLTYFNLANLYVQKSDYDNALNYFNKAISLDSTNADAYKNIAIIYYIKEKYDFSLIYFEKALNLIKNEKDRETIINDIKNLKQKINIGKEHK